MITAYGGEGADHSVPIVRDGPMAAVRCDDRLVMILLVLRDNRLILRIEYFMRIKIIIYSS